LSCKILVIYQFFANISRNNCYDFALASLHFIRNGWFSACGGTHLLQIPGVLLVRLGKCLTAEYIAGIQRFHHKKRLCLNFGNYWKYHRDTKTDPVSAIFLKRWRKKDSRVSTFTNQSSQSTGFFLNSGIE
jgi:hypothetical protein